MSEQTDYPLVNELRLLADDIFSKKGENRFSTIMSRAADALVLQQEGSKRLNGVVRDYATTIEQLRDVVAEFTEGNALAILKAARHLVEQRGADNVKAAFADLVKAVKG